MLQGGDVLARGAHSAQFSAGGNTLTDFEADFVFKAASEVCEKYGLSVEEYDQYAVLRDSGQRLPDLKATEQQETLDAGFSITDHRTNYLSEPIKVKVAEPVTKKYPESAFEPVQTIMDRLLVMVISDDPNVELLEDGSTRDKRTGLITAAKYRQHSNVGIVLLAGQWVITGGMRTCMWEIVQPGDKVIYGDYNSEMLPMSDEKAQELCDRIGVNYEKTEQGLRLVRVQDVRTVQRRVQQGNAVSPSGIGWTGIGSCEGFKDNVTVLDSSTEVKQ